MAKEEGKVHRSVRLIATVLGLAGVAFHLGVTALAVAPTNPEQVKRARVINTYMGQHFQQAWTLFAPEPVNDQRVFLIRVRFADQSESGWVDITSPGVESAQRNRFFASRDSRFQLNMLQMVFWSDPLANRLRERYEDLPDDLVKVPEQLPHERETVKGVHRVLEHFAGSEARRIFGKSVEAVQVRIAINRFPPLSQGELPDADGELKTYDLPWMVLQ